jgi:hypothetical protein
MEASAGARLAVISRPVPGQCGSRAAAPARDFDQRSSDNNVPLLIE